MRWRRRPRPSPSEPQDRFNGLSEDNLNVLGTYNAERARGIAHTAEYRKKMAVLQARFDAAERERYERRQQDLVRRRTGDQQR